MRENGATAEAERAMTRSIRRSAKQDREQWLTDMAGSRDWSDIRALRGKLKKKQGRLHNLQGIPVSSEERAETFAEYLEKVQWTVRPAAVVPQRPPIREKLEVRKDNFSYDELSAVLRKLRRGRAAGCDEIPPDFWKALLEDRASVDIVINFCNECWHSRDMPELWQKARVCEIFKKGDASKCGNYRPISLLCVGYKVSSALLLNRLKEANCDAQIWHTQFAFKRGRGTVDALFTARRLIEQSCAHKDDSRLLLALDWSKAFDCISPVSLTDALARFGVPPEMVAMIERIYSMRNFFVSECGVRSADHPQPFGISQGCPLSPYLFSILMSVLMHDAHQKLNNDFGIRFPPDKISDLLYADDTLLVGGEAHVLQKYMDCIIGLGLEYGLELNWSKVEMMKVGVQADVLKPDVHPSQ